MYKNPEPQGEGSRSEGTVEIDAFSRKGIIAPTSVAISYDVLSFFCNRF